VPHIRHEERGFYSAIVVAVYGGEPEFSPVYVEEYDLVGSGFGVLRFDGSQVYYALDGQRRLKSIQEAVRLNADLAKEEIVVIILKHEATKAALERMRRLFST
jgi:DNA sulfur modification protein DndB